MLSLRRPSPETIKRFLARQPHAVLSYEDAGCTRGDPPRRYFVDRYRILLGRGDEVFTAACAALSRWEMFRLGWVEPYPTATSFAVGNAVGVLIRACGLWWLNAARIVYVHELDDGKLEFGFAYGTLREHAERGEERFWIRRDSDNRIWYEVVAASRPGGWYGWAGLPLVRRLQRRFAADSQRAMLRSVQSSTRKS
ncbi:MAG TPA: DUF1990 domain-containing protein [Pirellulales bacterium]|jgi:uncharacterized protein (UPF0548 family)